MAGVDLMDYQRPEIQKLGSLKVFLEPTLSLVRQTNVRMDWRVQKLKDFIDGQDGKMGWDLAQVCQQLDLGITAAYAGKLFTHNMDIGLREYAMRQRFGKAAETLKSTSRSVKEIAADLGYRSPQDLARGFKNTFHLSPIKYRCAYHLAQGFSSATVGNEARAKNHNEKRSSSTELSLHAGAGKR